MDRIEFFKRLDEISAERSRLAALKLAAKAEAEARIARALERKARRQEIPFLEHSSVERPVALVWDLASQLLRDDPEISQPAIVAICVQRGVATNTAKTQIRAFFKALGR